MLKRLTLILFLGMLGVSSSFAQNAFSAFYWEEGNLALWQPYGWQVATDFITSETPRLTLAPLNADSAESRPIALPFITVTRYNNAQNKQEVLAQSMQAIGISNRLFLPDTQPTEAQGSSADGLLFGISRILELPDGNLLVGTGRTLAQNKSSFLAQFEGVFSTLTPNASSAPLPLYGQVWQRQYDGTRADLSPSNILTVTMTPERTRLFVLDSQIGIVEMNPTNGKMLSSFALEGLFFRAFATDGINAYAIEENCRCVMRGNIPTNTWSEMPLQVTDSAQHLVMKADGTAYLSDWLKNADNTETPIVWELKEAEARPLYFEDTLNATVWLALDEAQQVFALTSENALYRQEGVGFTYVAQIDSIPLPLTTFAVGASNALILATESELLVFSANGLALNRINHGASHGLGVVSDGTLITAQTTLEQSTLTAISAQVRAEQVGLSPLQAGQIVGGHLSETAVQFWTLQGNRDERLTLTTLATEDSPSLSLGIRLIHPNGQIMAEHTPDSFGIAQISDFRLPDTGNYGIIVYATSGNGRYRLGRTSSESLILEANVPFYATGELSAVLPNHRWQWQAEAGQTLALTLVSLDGMLDPYLTVYSASGEKLAENDDSPELGIGNGAFIRFSAPTRGVYWIEASMLLGEGGYALTADSP